jgi:glycosyltransferase involved in cell wall biosynthesis
VNEAMACGRPVITTSAAGCAPDLVTDGWNGAVVPAGDQDQLAAAMSRFAQDPELSITMGRRSAERILNHSPEACAAGFVDALAALPEIL